MTHGAEPEPRAPQRRSAGWQRLAIGIALALASIPARAGSAAPERVEAGRLGSVALFAPAARPRALVFLFSDTTGAMPALTQVAQQLASEGVASLIVDLPAYLRALAASNDGCHYLISEIEELSKREQRALGSTVYHSPILAGVGQGGTLAIAALAQAPAATLGAAVALDPAPRLATRVPLCAGAPASAAPGGGFRFGTPPPLHAPLWIAADEANAERARWREVLRTEAQAAFVVPRGEGEAARLLDALQPALAAALPAVSDLAHLPLVEIRAAKPGPLFAVIYSGDGGWRDLDKTLGEFLATQGVSTVGVDSLRYFWHEKSPDRVASDLATILAVYRTRFGAEHVLLIGYSFGADILPFAFNRLPVEEQARVVQITLLGVGSHAAFEFHLSNWAPGPDTKGQRVLPELARMDLARLQCVYGSEEDDTLCPLPELKAAEVIRTQGGHHFDGDYRALGQRILDGARRRLAADPTRSAPAASTRSAPAASNAQRVTTPTTPPEINEATSVSTKASANPPGAAR